MREMEAEEDVEALVREMEAEMETAVLKIQAGFRGMRGRRMAAAIREEQEAESSDDDELRRVEAEALAEYEAALREEVDSAALTIQTAWHTKTDLHGVGIAGLSLAGLDTDNTEV